MDCRDHSSISSEGLAASALTSGVRLFGGLLLASPLLYLMGILTWNTLPYYTFRTDLPFFLEKATAFKDPLWRVCFYVHITGGLVCLFSPVLQFSKRVLYRWPALHRSLGQVYVSSVFWLVAPGGFYLALYAKGGTWGPILFTLLGVLHVYFTWFGLKSMQGPKPDVRRHAAWMIRSYSMALSALSFRLFYVGLILCGVEQFYLHALWLSIAVNLVVAECLIAITLNNKRTIT